MPEPIELLQKSLHYLQKAEMSLKILHDHFAQNEETLTRQLLKLNAQPPVSEEKNDLVAQNIRHFVLFDRLEERRMSLAGLCRKMKSLIQAEQKSADKLPYWRHQFYRKLAAILISEGVDTSLDHARRINRENYGISEE